VAGREIDELTEFSRLGDALFFKGHPKVGIFKVQKRDLSEDSKFFKGAIQSMNILSTKKDFSEADRIYSRKGMNNL
jgi:hypothetical protein